MAQVTAEVEVADIVPARGQLTADVEQWLLTGLIEALPGMKMAQLFAHRVDMFHDADLITVVIDPAAGGRPVGALSSKWVRLPSGRPFLHILTQFIGERYQSGQAFKASWTAHFAAVRDSAWGFPDLLVLKTYNPIAYCAMCAFARIPDASCYPDVTLPEQRPEAKRLAAEVAAVISPGHEFDPVTGVIRGAGLPHDLYPELPLCRRERVNDYFATAARPGDRVLTMLELPTKQAAAMLLGAFGLC